jgi:hypothetical protein
MRRISNSVPDPDPLAYYSASRIRILRILQIVCCQFDNTKSDVRKFPFWPPVEFICLNENFLSVMWSLKKLCLLKSLGAMGRIRIRKKSYGSISRSAPRREKFTNEFWPGALRPSRRCRTGIMSTRYHNQSRYFQPLISNKANGDRLIKDNVIAIKKWQP